MISKTFRIYLFSIALSLVIVLAFFAIQSRFIMRIFEPRMLFVPVTMAVVIGLLLGKIQVLGDRLGERNRLFSALADFALEFTYFRKTNGEYEYVSPACKRVTGYEMEDFYRQPNFMNQLIHPDDSELWEKHIHNINGKGIPESIEVRILTKEGHSRWIEHLCCTVQNEKGNIIGVRSTNIDISRRKEYEQQIEYLAKYDPLTMLPNRRWLMESLQDQVRQAGTNKRHFAVMFLDLDRFKYINDTFGHAVGDALLAMIASKFKGVWRSGGNDKEPMFISRFGGDEFVIIDNMSEGAEPAQTAAQILSLLDQSFTVNEHDFNVTGSVGIAVFPYDGKTPEDLIKNADAAMYKAKREGKNNIQFYSSDLAKEMSEFYRLERYLKQALERDEFVLHYQPQIDLASGKVTGVEALVRWNSPENGLVPPLRFIPVAEETGLIGEIGELVFRKACAQWRRWSDQGIKLKVAVNVSPIQFRDDHFCSRLETLLEDVRMPPAYLEVEVTESVLMGNSEKARAKLNILRDMGIPISIDDFGTGYSSMEYLKELPISSLKIDASFVREIQDNVKDLAIVKTIEALARNLQIHTVAEGIEETGQLELLKEIGCTIGQGYLISRPMPAEGVEALLLAVGHA